MTLVLANHEHNELQIHFMRSVKDNTRKMEFFLLKTEAQNDQIIHQSNLASIMQISQPLKNTARIFKFDCISLICHKIEDYITNLLRNKKIISKEEITKIFKHVELINIYADEFLDKKEINDSEYQIKFQKLFAVPINPLDATKKLHDNSLKLQVLFIGVSDHTFKHALTSFNNLNCHLSYANDVLEAFNRISHEHFDLIILNYSTMPINGMSFNLAVKNQWGNKAPKIILIHYELISLNIENKFLPDKIIIESGELSSLLESFLVSEFSQFKKIHSQVVARVKHTISSIYFVEDDGNIRDLFGAVFEEKEDIVLFNEVTKKDPFERILQLMPNLIMCDIEVPNVDAVSLLKRIKAHEDLAAIPVVYFSGDPEQPLAAELVKHGALAVLDKTIILTSMFSELKKLGLEFQS